MNTLHIWIGCIVLWAGLLACEQRQPTTVSDFPVDSTTKYPRIPLRAEQATVGNIAIAVDHSLEPLIQAEIETFMGLNRQAFIRPAYLPGEEAIAMMLASDTVRLAISTRRLTFEETELLRAENVYPDYAVIGYEGVALVAHPSNPDTVLSLDEIKRILTGQVTTWRDLSSQGSSEPLQVVFDQRQSGLMRFLQDSILNGQSIKGPNLFALDSTQAVIDYVADHPQALGLVGWAWLSDIDEPVAQRMRAQVQVVLVDAPTDSASCPYNQTYFGPYQSFLATQCYALSRPILTIRREVFHGLGAGFLSFMLSYAGQRIIHKSGLAAVKGIPREVRLPPRPGAKDIEN